MAQFPEPEGTVVPDNDAVETVTEDDSQNAFVIINRLAGHGLVVENQFSGTQFCRTYSDGWLEQGSSSTSEITQNRTVSYIKPFRDTNYTLAGVGFVIALSGRQTVTKNTASFSTGSDAQNSGTYGWFACGYGVDESE